MLLFLCHSYWKGHMVFFNRLFIQKTKFSLLGVFHGEDVLISYTRWKLPLVHHTLEGPDSSAFALEEVCQWFIFGPWLILDKNPFGVLICYWIPRFAILSNWQKYSMLYCLSTVIFIFEHLLADMSVEISIRGKVR